VEKFKNRPFRDAGDDVFNIAGLALGLLIAHAAFGASPPVGGDTLVQGVKTGSYTIKPTDLNSQLLFQCSAPCTVTLPAITASTPRGYPVVITNAGGRTVTISSTSPITGPPTTGGHIILPALGSWAKLTADPAGHYVAVGP
jgi:hypothetical protein